jgi:tripartite-type tricarboxylate transporter receptor subunit TctC
MLWQNAGIVSNALWNARPARGVLEMIHMGKGWTEGGQMPVSMMHGAHSGRRRRALVGILAALALPLGCALSHAAYPERVITLIVPFPAGGPTDIIARIVSVGLQKSLGQSVIVDNRGGGGGNPGMAIAARAQPDGYTLLLTSTAIAVNPAIYKSLPYDPLKDFASICELVNAPNVLFVRSDSGISSVADLVARAKAAPGALNYSSPGAGTKSHLAAEQLKLRAGIDMVHIPYRGGGPATMAVLEGTVQVGSVALAPVEPLIKEGKFTALAVTGAERWFSLPDVPTMIESGFPGFVSDTFNALFAPAGTPPEIIALLSRETRATLKMPQAREQAHRAGYQIVGGTPEELAARLASEIPAVKELVARLGIKLEEK